MWRKERHARHRDELRAKLFRMTQSKFHEIFGPPNLPLIIIVINNRASNGKIIIESSARLIDEG